MPKRAALSPRAALATALFLVSLLHSKSLLSSPDPLDAAPSRFATSEGAKVHYKSLGDPASKTAVVFVHGWSCDLTSWRAQVPAFEGKARMLLIDLPGHGKSARPAVDYTMDRFANAVEAVMRDAGVERAVLVGHSMGTPVARQFWRKWPLKTIGISAVDGALRTFFKDSTQVDAFVARFAGPEFGKTMNGFFESMFVATTPESVKADVRRMSGAFTQPVAASAMRGMFDPAIWKDDAIAVPLQVIVAKSPMWSADYFEYVKTLNPDAEIVEIPDAGHFVMMDFVRREGDRAPRGDVRAHRARVLDVRGPPRPEGRRSLRPRDQLVPAPFRRIALVGRDDLLGSRVRLGQDPREVPARISSALNPAPAPRGSRRNARAGSLVARDSKPRTWRVRNAACVSSGETWNPASADHAATSVKFTSAVTSAFPPQR